MILLNNETCPEIENQFVVCKLCSVAGREVVPVITALRNDTCSIGSGSGNVGLILVVAR